MNSIPPNVKLRKIAMEPKPTGRSLKLYQRQMAPLGATTCKKVYNQQCCFLFVCTTCSTVINLIRNQIKVISFLP